MISSFAESAADIPYVAQKTSRETSCETPGEENVENGSSNTNPSECTEVEE